jgi:hypothetical protein
MGYKIAIAEISLNMQEFASIQLTAQDVTYLLKMFQTLYNRP